jgi:L-lactate utilization protein LutC
MGSARDDFLANVRRAVAAGNRAGDAPALPERAIVGYQGAGRDPVARFCAEFTAAGGCPQVVADAAAAVAAVRDIVAARGARRVLLGRGPVVDPLGLAPTLRAGGVDVAAVDGLAADDCRDAFFAADVGVSGVDYLVAETGSLALFSHPGQPRSLSLLPPVHVAVAARHQILPDLFDLFAAQRRAEGEGLPASLSIVTGPSKTGDIELRLVTGVHGPGEVHVVLIDGPDAGNPVGPAPAGL